MSDGKKSMTDQELREKTMFNFPFNGETKVYVGPAKTPITLDPRY